jgi:hypothetical protein
MMPADDYQLNIVVDIENYVIVGSEDIIYYNKGSTDLNEVYFNLYANAFRDMSSVPVNDIDAAYPNGFDPGYIDVDVRKYDHEIENDTHLKIILDKPLGSGEFLSLHIDFEIKVPNTLNRFGHYEDVLYAANCFPIAAVNDNGSWALYPFISRGDPFFSESANWDVDLNLEKGWELATTGTIKKKYDNGEYFEYEIDAPMTRDFAFSCSPRYSKVSEEYNGIEVFSFYLDGHQEGGAKALEYAIESIQFFEDLYGDYPYETYTLAETFLGIGGGMEYPQLSFIDSDYYEEYEGIMFQLIVVHETAHQWWYCVVGNDEYMDSFIDESLAQYSTMIFLEQIYGELGYSEYIFGTYKENVFQTVNIMDLALDEYASDDEYYMMAYIKGPVVLDMMATYTGEEGFIEFLADLYDKYMYGVINKEIVVMELDESFPQSGAGNVFNTLASTDQIPDAMPGGSYYLEDGHYDIIIDYSNDLKIPVEVMVNYNDGSSELIGPLTMYSGKNGGTIKSFEIDPNDKLVEMNEINNIGMLELREEEDINKTNYVYYAILAIIIMFIALYAYKKRYG